MLGFSFLFTGVFGFVSSRHLAQLPSLIEAITQLAENFLLLKIVDDAPTTGEESRLLLKQIQTSSLLLNRVQKQTN